MAWTAIGKGSDNKYYYRDGNNWFGTPGAPLKGDNLEVAVANRAKAEGSTIQTGPLPKESWPNITGWKNSIDDKGVATYTYEGTNPRSVKSPQTFQPGDQGKVAQALQGAVSKPPAAPKAPDPGEKPPYAPKGTPSYPLDMLGAADRLEAAGIHPWIYFTITPPPGGLNPPNDMSGKMISARKEYSAQIAEAAKGQEGDRALRARMAAGDANKWLSYYREQKIPVEVAWRNLEGRGLIRQGTTYPKNWNENRLVKPNDIPESRLSVINDKVSVEVIESQDELTQLRETGLGLKAQQADTVRADTARHILVNNWLDHMVNNEKGWSRSDALLLLQNMDPPLVNKGGRIRNDFDPYRASRQLLPDNSEAPRVPMLLNGEKLKPGDQIPAGQRPMADAVTRAFVATWATPSAAAKKTSNKEESDPTLKDGKWIMPDGVKVTPPSGTDSKTLNELAEKLRFLNQQSNLTEVPQRLVSTGALDNPPPAGLMPSDISSPEPNSAQDLAYRSRAQRMQVIGFTPQLIAEYDRQERNTLGRVPTVSEIDSAFQDIPVGERVETVTHTRDKMQDYLRNEAALGIQSARPGTSSKDALKMADEFFRKRGGVKGDRSPSLDKMIESREGVREDIRALTKSDPSSAAENSAEKEPDFSKLPKGEQERAKLQWKQQERQLAADKARQERELTSRKEERIEQEKLRKYELNFNAALQDTMTKLQHNQQRELAVMNAGLNFFSQVGLQASQSSMQIATGASQAGLQGLMAMNQNPLYRDIVPGMFGGSRRGP